jgi:hypothetical protein
MMMIRINNNNNNNHHHHHHYFSSKNMSGDLTYWKREVIYANLTFNAVNLI